jgi:hypothetical protein
VTEQHFSTSQNFGHEILFSVSCRKKLNNLLAVTFSDVQLVNTVDLLFTIQPQCHTSLIELEDILSNAAD